MLVEVSGSDAGHDEAKLSAFVDEGAKIWLQPAEEGSSRKLAYTWELLEHRGIVCSTNTVRPNKLVAALLQARALPGADEVFYTSNFVS